MTSTAALEDRTARLVLDAAHEAVRTRRAGEVTELRIAAQMQQQLLPPSYCLTELAELAAVTTPCRDVGGDLFDYATRFDGVLSFVVADVAGKGTSAALLTPASLEALYGPGTAALWRKNDRAQPV